MAVLVDELTATRENISTFQCGGSLISPRVVLTVAHCITNSNRNSLIIRAGEWDSLSTDEYYPHQDREVEEVIIHEMYNDENVHNDIALLVLRVAVTRAENVNTVCLPPANANFDRSSCFAAGWGQVSWEEPKLQSIMKRIELPVVPSEECQRVLRTTRLSKHFILDKSFICAGGEKDKDTCTGDGGSPLVRNLIIKLKRKKTHGGFKIVEEVL